MLWFNGNVRNGSDSFAAYKISFILNYQVELNECQSLIFLIILPQSKDLKVGIFNCLEIKVSHASH